MSKVQQLAKVAYENLIWVYESNQVVVSPDAPRWVWDFVQKIHDIDDQLPNDWVFQKSKDILLDLMNGEEPEVAPDIYTHELLEWLRTWRHWERVNGVLRDYPGEFSSLSDVIRAAQARKIADMVGVIRGYLEELD